MRKGWAALPLACASLAWPDMAAAQQIAVDLPAGRVGEQVMALGRLGRASIVVPDRRLWSRRVPALRGRLSVPEALRVLASRSDARIETLGPASWRLSGRAPSLARPSPPPPRRPPPPRGDPPEAMGADIVVIASKRDVPVQRFAGQTHRISGPELELGGAGGTEKLAARLSSVASTHLGAGRNKLFIRGIADSSFTGPTQATVGQYFGDLRLSYNAPDPDLRLTDLAAVEVLEGPQGTLYGAGSLGGLIRLVPNAPDLSNASASASVGGAVTRHGDLSADAQAMLNLPVISDRLALRVTGTASDEGGYIDKPLLGRTDVNRTRIQGGRASALLRLGPGWQLEVVGIGQRIRGTDSQYADRDGPPLTRRSSVTEGFSADFGQLQLVASGMIGDVHLRSTSGLTAHDLVERYDATSAGGAAQLFAQANRTRMLANETRLWRSSPDGAGWLLGSSYVDNEARLTRLLGPPDDLQPTTGVTNRIAEATLYGDVGARLLPGVLLTGGLRVTRTVLDGASEDTVLPLSDGEREITASRSQTMLLPAASALIDLSRGTTLFVRYQQGFRPGGIAIESDTVRRFRSDRVATIEAGIRSGLAKRDPVDFNLTLAHTSWRDIQADFIDATGLPTTANIGDGTLWTLEAGAGAMIASGLRLEAAATLNKSRISDPSYALAMELGDPSASDLASARASILARLRQIPNIARITARVGATYEQPIRAGADLKVDAWLRYVGSSRLGIGPVLGQLQGSYVDSGAVARLGLGQLGVSLGITNLANVRGNRFALGTPFATGRDQVTPLRPRTIRVGVDAAF